MREPPEVTVRDPGREGRPADVLGDDRPRWRPSRWQLAMTGLLVAALGAGAAGRALYDRRTERAAERRLSGVVALERALRFGGETITHTPEDTGIVELRIGLRNTGPREITVLAAALGSMTLPEPVRLGPDDEAPLRLVQTFDCATRPALLPVEQDVLLRVRTGQGVREVVLRLEPDQTWDEAQPRRACDYLDPVEAGTLVPTASRLAGRAVVVDLEVANSGRDPLRLVSVAAGTGLSLALQTPAGAPVALPLDLPTRVAVQDPQVLHLQAVLRVTDCRSVLPTSETFEEGGAASVSFTVGGAAPRSGEGPSTSWLPDPQPVADLVARVC